MKNTSHSISQQLPQTSALCWSPIAALRSGNDSVFNMSLGEQLLDYLSVEKVAEYLTTLVNYKNGIFNVCKGEPISLRRFLENRMSEKGKFIKLNLGYYDYRKQDSIAIWGDKSFEKQLR